MVAALFALHPIDVESVVWIAERKNLLSMLFFLLALGAYGWYAHKPRVDRYVVVTLLFALGLMAKPQVITFPCLVLLWDYWPLQRMSAGRNTSSSTIKTPGTMPARKLPWLILEKLPLLALSVASAIVTVRAQRADSAVSNPLNTFPFAIRLGNAVLSYAQYLKTAFWPSRLSILYPHPGYSLQTWHVFVTLFLLMIITALVVRNRRHHYLLVGWFWFLGSLVPMIGLIQVGSQAMADRYDICPLWACSS
jgi:protein O-mannosyl-transferase